MSQGGPGGHVRLDRSMDPGTGWYGAVISMLDGCLVQLDAEDRIVAVDEELATAVGVAPDELLGRPLASALTDESADRVRTTIRALGAGEVDGAVAVPVTLLRSDGDGDPTDLRLAALRDGGTVQGTLGVFADVGGTASTEERDDELRTGFDRVTDAIIGLDDDGRFTFANERAAALLDRDRGELLGRPALEVLPAVEDTPFVAHALGAMASQESTRFEARFEPLDAWFDVRLHPSESGITVHFRDVTDRKRRERELERYRAVVETVEDGIYVLDEDGRFDLVNRAYAEMAGYDRSTLLGEPASLLADEATVARARELGDELASGDRSRATVQATLQGGDGEPIEAEATLTSMATDDGHQRVGVVRDVTERVAYETALAALHETTRRLFEDATPRAVAETLVATATQVLAFPEVAVYLHDPDDDVLRAVAVAEASAFERRDFPTLPADAGSITGHAFSTGELLVYDDVRESPHVYNEGTEMRGTMYAPVGDHGVLVAGSRAVGAVDERDRQLVALLAGNGEAALDRLARERRLAEYERIVRTVDDGVYVLDEGGRFTLVNDAFAAMLGRDRAALVGTPATTVFGDGFVGPTDDLVAEDGTGDRAVTSVETWVHPASRDPIPVESRFTRMDLPDGGHGWVGVVRDVTERRVREREIDHQRASLAWMNRVSSISRQLTRSVIESRSRGEIERVVCAGFAESAYYGGAWVGTVDLDAGTVEPRTVAGVDGPTAGTAVALRDEGSPIHEVIEHGRVRVARAADGRDGALWRPVTGDGFGSAAAVPVTHEGALYGVLAVYAGRPDGFDPHERRVLADLGGVVGHAIAALERKEALVSADLLEAEIRICNMAEVLGVEELESATIDFDRIIPLGGDQYLEFGTVDDAGLAAVRAFVDGLDHWRDVTVSGGRFGEHRFEASLTSPPLVSMVAERGAQVHSARVEGGTYTAVIRLPPGGDLRRVLDGVRTLFPSAEVVAQRRTTRGQRGAGTDSAWTRLTERQRAVIEAAYFAGFYRWPRERTGEEVARSLDIAAPTFHQHLRAAERNLLAGLLDAD